MVLQEMSPQFLVLVLLGAVSQPALALSWKWKITPALDRGYGLLGDCPSLEKYYHGNSALHRGLQCADLSLIHI